ncbi:hypothetical protein GCM10009556_038230 [Acrocarpospora pleiomorpha]
MANSPVTLEITGIRGGSYAIVSATAWNSASIGSISGEWNACDTRSRLVLRSLAAHPAATSSTAGSTPAITTDAGPLTAAMDTSSSRPASDSRISSSSAWIATMAPPAGSACINRPRAATSAQASSRVNTPATCAATSSPIECPASASGRTPHDSTSR